MTDAEYNRLRRGVRLWRWFTPVFVVFQVLWVSQSQGYPAGDWRGDVVGRAIFTCGMTAFFVAGLVFGTRRLRAADRVPHPVTSKERVAAVARGYLDDQTRLVPPGLHQPPVVVTMTATFARDASRLEPRIPVAQAATQPARTVWVVTVAGDVLNLHDLPWSHSGDSCPSGNLVIDDATATILGVYPHTLGP